MLFRAITGPTGVGKTKLAFGIASRKSGLSVVNADAFQFYKEIPILSNQDEIPKSLPTYFFADRSIERAHSAGAFAVESEHLLSQNCLWVGTGLYLHSSLYGLDSDRRKGTPFQGEPKSDFRILVLDEDRQQLYDKLNRRVDEMLERGGLEEAKKIWELLIEGKISKDLPALKAIGLRQLLQFLEGEISLERALETWKQESRYLAKRQWTWLRKFCPPSERVIWRKWAEIDPNFNELDAFFEF